MAYNTQDAVNTILRLKGNWLNANAEGDTKKTAQIANEAQNYYGQMRGKATQSLLTRFITADMTRQRSMLMTTLHRVVKVRLDRIFTA